MTTWVDAQERPEYVVAGYVVGNYVEITYIIADGSGTSWVDAAEASPDWTSAE